MGSTKSSKKKVTKKSPKKSAKPLSRSEARRRIALGRIK